jgi:DNA invertase Pin-like site-specific DNA recombinase
MEVFNMNSWAYVRVSSQEQRLDRQMDTMEKLGIPKEHIFYDKASGKDFNRPAYQAMLRRVKKGDTIFLSSLDRLGRSYKEIQNQWRILTKDIGVDIVVLDQAPLLDTRIHKDLMGTFIADLIMSLLSLFSETERGAILRRQAEGIAAAKARGVRFGRPCAELPGNFGDLVAKWDSGALDIEEILVQCGVSRSTFYKYLAQYRLVHPGGA